MGWRRGPLGACWFVWAERIEGWGPTVSPFPPDQFLERVDAHQHRVVPLHRDIALLEVFLVDLVRVARAVREQERDEKGLRG